MKKIILVFLCLILAFLIFALPAYAADIDNEQIKALNADDLSESIPSSAQFLEDLDVSNSLNTEKWFIRIKDFIYDNLLAFLKTGLKSAISVLLVSLLCGIVDSVKADEGEFDYISLVGVIAISAIAFTSVDSFLKEACSASEEIHVFSKAVLPTITAAAVSGGAITSGPLKLSICAMFMDISISIAQGIIFPLIYAYFALNIAGSAFRSGLLKIADLIKSIIKMILTILCLVFTAYLSISGIVADSADAVTAKAAKTMISTALPVVGSMISDAASTVVSGVSVIRNAVGVFGVIVVCAVCIVPFLKLGTNYILFKGSALISSCFTDSKVSKMIENTASVYSLALGVIGVEGIMLFFSLISLIKAVTV